MSIINRLTGREGVRLDAEWADSSHADQVFGAALRTVMETSDRSPAGRRKVQEERDDLRGEFFLEALKWRETNPAAIQLAHAKARRALAESRRSIPGGNPLHAECIALLEVVLKDDGSLSAEAHRLRESTEAARAAEEEARREREETSRKAEMVVKLAMSSDDLDSDRGTSQG